MSNTRPAAARKQTARTRAKMDDELNTGVSLTLDGKTYTVRPGDLSARIERELRREFGGSFDALRTELGRDPGLDSFATFVWLARRIDGEDVTLDDVEVSYRQFLDDGFSIEVVGKPDEEHDSPEA